MSRLVGGYLIVGQAEWIEHRRQDGEPIGWVRPEGEEFVPVDRLGRDLSRLPTGSTPSGLSMRRASATLLVRLNSNETALERDSGRPDLDLEGKAGALPPNPAGLSLTRTTLSRICEEYLVLCEGSQSSRCAGENR